MTAWRSAKRRPGLAVCLAAVAIFSTGCASLPPQSESVPSYALSDTADTHLGRQYRPLVLPRVGETGVHPLKTGAEALVARLLLADEPTGNLDSATERDIMGLFSELHEMGHTIIVVTHEPSIAARCPRAIRLADGKIIRDGPGAEVAGSTGAGARHHGV